MKSLVAVLAVALIVAVGSAQDEDKEPAALTKAREGFMLEMAKVVVPTSRNYLVKLDALKKELGGKGDLEGAKEVQKEIEKVMEQLDAYRTKSQVEKEAERIAIGTWALLCLQSGFRDTLFLYEDGTCKVKSGETGNWAIKETKFVIQWKSGKTSTATLPLKKKMTVASSWAGEWTFEKTK
jgi:hypothetical protein